MTYFFLALTIIILFIMLHVGNNIQELPSKLNLYYVSGDNNFIAYKNKQISLQIISDKELKIGQNYTIPIREIKSISVKDETQLIEQEKSIIGRALVGGIIAGPIGAVIGGMTGLPKNQKEQRVYFLILDTIYDKHLIFALRDLEFRDTLMRIKGYIQVRISSK